MVNNTMLAINAVGYQRLGLSTWQSTHGLSTQEVVEDVTEWFVVR